MRNRHRDDAGTMRQDEEHAEAERLPLDALVAMLGDPSFASRHRRRLSLRESSPHVNPLMLAVAGADSLYVREWRDHSRGCPACAELFRYFGFG